MSAIYHIRIKKDYATAIIDDLQKMKAIELIKGENEGVEEWQKTEVRKRVKEAKKNPSILVEEEVVFNMLKKG